MCSTLSQSLAVTGSKNMDPVLDVLIQMYKVEHNLAPKHLADSFTVKENKYSLGNSEFKIPCFSTVEYGKHTQLKLLWPIYLVRAKGQ